MIDLPKGAKREVDDIMLTRYACYLIAQNGDPMQTMLRMVGFGDNAGSGFPTIKTSEESKRTKTSE